MGFYKIHADKLRNGKSVPRTGLIRWSGSEQCGMRRSRFRHRFTVGRLSLHVAAMGCAT